MHPPTRIVRSLVPRGPLTPAPRTPLAPRRLLTFLALLAVTPAPARAQGCTAAEQAALAGGGCGAARSLAVLRLDADLRVQPDGQLLVTEHIRAAFEGSWKGLVRTIPVEYPGPRGFNYTLRVRVLGAEDEDGRRLRTEKRRRDGSLVTRIYVPGAKDATRTITLRYSVANAIRHFEGYDELWWNVIGTEGDLPIAAGSARVYLPADASGLRVQAYEGPFGSIERAIADTSGGTYVYARNARPLGVSEALTVDVAWNPGAVALPTETRRAAWFVASNAGLGLPVLALLVLLPLWYLRGRDPRRRPIAPRYEAPDRMSPAEAGTLLDNRPDMRDVTAALVDLAVRGFLRIQEQEHPRLLGLFPIRDYVFHSTKDASAWATLQPHERQLLQGLFDHGKRPFVAASELTNEFYKELPGIRAALFDEMVGRGYYRHRPDRVSRTVVVGGVAVAAALALAGGAFAERVLGQDPLSFYIGGGVAALLVVIFARIMPARTLAGTRALEGVLGFQEFLRRVEGDRLERVVKTPELFERCLPYAMAFGVESNWARAFETIYREPPRWYQGQAGGPFRVDAFTSDLNHMCGRAGHAMSAAPRGSAGGTGFGGGGGSSGGGFGGGGVGGF